jgi:hypothetical protein
MVTALEKDYAITFYYYQDMFAVVPFYENVLGFDLVLDQGMARIYRIAPNAYFGIVDGNRGHLHHQTKSAALLTLVVKDVAGWHARLAAVGVDGLTEIRTGTYCEHFFF